MATGNIFDTLAQQDTQRAAHDAAPVTPAAQPNIFDTLAANEGNLQKHDQPQGPSMSANPNASQIPTFGTPDQSPQQRLTMPLVKALITAHDKLKEVENLTQEGRQAHPIQAHIGDLANRIEGLLTGNEEHPEAAIGTGKYGMATNPVLAAVAGAPEAAEMAGAGEAAIRGLGAGKAAGAEGPGLIKQALQGREVEQAPAAAAIRSAAGAEEETPLLAGHENVLDEPLKSISQKERAAYKAQDEAAGFDVKETRAKLKEAEYKVKQPEIDEATHERLTKTIEESKKSIGEAEKKMSEAGVDPKAADTLFKQRKAGEDFRKAIVQHVSADGESVNVDGLLNAAKKLRNTPKGDRLEQFLGSAEKADKFMEDLQQAKKIGAHALTVQRVAKLIGGAVGVGAVEETIRAIH